MQGVRVPSPVGELRSHTPCGQKTKTQNRSSIVTNSVKTLKMVHGKKNLKKKKQKLTPMARRPPKSNVSIIYNPLYTGKTLSG